ncbi:hypothetical protein Rvan_3322 [Rhodomicrobium vannielii ATCC 17100]|uniref:Bacteriophage P22, Gp10, DNA-stabilising n=1 Tax=Rhodomicrobium vannielii (strain ATCC 17100 / DSM 162 / LMG 4299 / NCIMB 10020 / ATH 3.1.1) TaxID=648757 RepID=E3I2R2_RHOVT|nr:hypothetical protein [Rhodomicrobium vannielii]ADP72507.1 hypothetical protein Rvan_3322 [Rhodomicrobium vannielii ATCC 17100]
MVSVEFGHTSNKDKSGFVSNQRLLNGYAEAMGRAAKSSLPVYAVPGTSRFDQGETGLDGPCRGMLYVYGKGLYVVAGTRAALFDDAGNATDVTGEIAGSGMVIMAANQETDPKVGIIADSVYYALDTATNAIAAPAITTLPAPNSVTFVDGYLVFSIADGRIFHTALNDAETVNALSFATATSRSDGLRRIVTHRGALIALGEASLEIWENAGTTPFAFAPIRADIDIGCIAEHTVASVADSLLFVDHNGVVRQLTGSEPQRISTHAIERAIAALSWDERRSLYAVYTHFNGHDFYAITSAYWTFEFDVATGLWHERASGDLEYWTARGHASFNGKVVIGSSLDASLHVLDDASYTESGQPYLFVAQSAPLHAFPNGLIVDQLDVDIIPGVGITSDDDEAADPKLMLDWSDDGGATWVGGRVAALGRVGERFTVASFHQLGAAPRGGRTFRLASSSPVMRGILSAKARVRAIAP